MPVVASQPTVLANTEFDVVAGTPYEFPGPAGNIYTVYAVTQTTGLVLDVEFGSKVLARGVPLGVVAANVAPRTDQDMRVREAALPGEKVRVVLRNPTGGNIIGNVLIDIS
jgi:hypothetical protein